MNDRDLQAELERLQLQNELEDLERLNAQEDAGEESKPHGMLGTIGMLGRAGLSNAMSLADLVTLPATLPVSLMGGPDLFPSGLAKKGVDYVTGDRLKPRTRGEKIVSGAVEWGSPASVITKGVTHAAKHLAPQAAKLAQKGIAKVGESVLPYTPNWMKRYANWSKRSLEPTVASTVGGVAAGATSGAMEDEKSLAGSLAPIGAGIGASLLTNAARQPQAFLHPIKTALSKISPSVSVRNKHIGEPFMKNLPHRLNLGEILDTNPEEAGRSIYKGGAKYEELTRKKHEREWGDIDKLGKNVEVNIRQPLHEVVSILEGFKDPALRNEFMAAPIGKELFRLSGLSEVRHIAPAEKVEIGRLYLRGLGESKRLKQMSAEELAQYGEDAIEELGLHAPIEPHDPSSLRDFGKKVADVFGLDKMEAKAPPKGQLSDADYVREHFGLSIGADSRPLTPLNKKKEMSDYDYVKLGEEHYKKWGNKLGRTAHEFLEAYHHNPHIIDRAVSFGEARQLRQSLDNTLSQKQFLQLGDADDAKIKSFRASMARALEDQAKAANPRLHKMVKNANENYSYYADVERPKLNTIRTHEREPSKTWAATKDLHEPGAETANFVQKTLKGTPDADYVAKSWARDLGRKGKKFDVGQFTEKLDQAEAPAQKAVMGNLNKDLNRRLSDAMTMQHNYDAIQQEAPELLELYGKANRIGFTAKAVAYAKNKALQGAMKSKTGQEILHEYLLNPSMGEANVAFNKARAPKSNKRSLALQGIARTLGEPEEKKREPLKVRVTQPGKVY